LEQGGKFMKLVAEDGGRMEQNCVEDKKGLKSIMVTFFLKFRIYNHPTF
jgi:hypothetical protein